MPLLSHITAYCVEVGLTPSDGSYLFNHWTSNGFTRGGKAIKDWKAMVRAWKDAGYMPSQKQNGHKLSQDPQYYVDGLGRRMRITAQNKEDAEYYLKRSVTL